MYLCPSGGMVDTVDSKSTAERRAGSSPAWGTKQCLRSLVVKHPSYTRHSPQIRERRWFESTRRYQLAALMVER